MNEAIIFDIQHFCIHDGDGIRTTVFFKGCPLRCAWCHNPESINIGRDMLYDSEKCIACGECVQRCSTHAITLQLSDMKMVTDLSKCLFSGDCVFYCVKSAREIVGVKKTVIQIVDEIAKDTVFYEESHGGVTLSGGEPLIQIDFVEQLLIGLKAMKINIAIDTCGYVPFSNLERAAKYVDTFLFDLKISDKCTHREYTGVSNELIIDNFRKLAVIHKNIHVRMPIIEGVNANDKHVHETLKLMLEVGIKKVSILPYHNIATHKYGKLGRSYSKDEMRTPSEEYIHRVRELYSNNGLEVTVGG